MLKIDLGTNTKKHTKSIYKIINGESNPVLLTDMLDNIKVITDMFISNKIFTLDDLVAHISDAKLDYVDDLTQVRTVNLIVNINNQPELSTDYSYLIDMLRVDRTSYNPIHEHGVQSATTITLPFEKPLKSNVPMLDVLLTLVNVLGYEQAIIVIKATISYNIDLD